MNKLLFLISIFIIQEIIAIVAFYFIRKRFEKKHTIEVTIFSIIKGILERAALLIGLALNIPTVITFFGAIKLGTRISNSEAQQQKISNDYFLIGNFTSVLLVLLSYSAYIKL